MVVRFGTQQSRGAAGQTSLGGPKRNFANLYQMNRSGQQIDRKANSMQQGVNQAQQMAADARTMSSGHQNRAGDVQGGQNLMAQAVDKAKGISNQAQGFTPGAQMMKGGASPYQASIGSFYAGGANSAGAQRIRKFGGLYSQVLGQRSAMEQALNRGAGNSIVTAPGRPGDTRTAYERDVARTDAQSTPRYVTSDTGQKSRTNKNDLSYMDNLFWAYKTGRISEQQYRKAQNDPAYYDTVMKGVN